MKIIIGYNFEFYATKMGSRDSWETKVDPYWVQDPPWSFNEPCHGPTIELTWLFIYWLYLCILWNKSSNWVQDLPCSFNGPCHGPTIHPTWPGLECELHIPFYEHFCYKNIDGTIKKMF